MGFSSSLQGEAAHEALISRQDAELRLLDNMKRCLSLRVKCDREYAIALNTVVLQVNSVSILRFLLSWKMTKETKLFVNIGQILSDSCISII